MELNILTGDSRDTLKTLSDKSVQCVVTSPPYFGLRDYGKDGQIGLEETPGEYVAALVDVFREVRRVLRDDGTMWLNLGDSYAGNGKGPAGNLGAKHNERHLEHVKSAGKVFDGLKPKDLIGIPWRIAFALQADGWHLRQDIIWAKPNPMPESVTDRCTKAHEYIFLLSKNVKYYYNAEVVKEESIYPNAKAPWTCESRTERAKPLCRKPTGNEANGSKYYGSKTRNRRSVWTVSTKPYSGAHFAVFPPDLIEPCILAGSKQGDTILDPFGGSGTTAAVALKHGRNAIICEINEEYVNLIYDRINSITDALRQEYLFKE